MALKLPDDLRNASTHEWVSVYGSKVTVGVSDYAQSELGDVTYLEFPSVGDEVKAGQPFGVIESVKAVEDLYAPVSGIVVGTNDEAVERPEVVNDDSYGDGWMLVIEANNPDEIDNLLTVNEYRDSLER